MLTARLPLRLRLPCAALAALLLWVAPPARGDEVPLSELERAFETNLARRDESAYERMGLVLRQIAERRDEPARALLARLLASYGAADRRRAMLIVGAQLRYAEPRDLDRAIAWVESRKDPLLVDLLHRALAELRLPATRRHLREGALRGAAPRVKAQILRALGEAGDPEALVPLMQAAREDPLLVRVEAIEALGALRDARARPLLQVFLKDDELHVRAAAARGLGRLGDGLARPPLERALEDPAPLVAEAAATALGALDDPAAIPALIAALERAQAGDLRLADALTDALQALSGKDIHADGELWRAWWETVKATTPFRKAQERPGRRTVPGPSYYGFPVRSSRVVFVLDVSRSMGWNGRLETAQQELVQVLEHLPRTTRFNLIVYSDEAARWRPGLAEASPVAVKRAVEFVRRQRALSGTNTYAALAAAFDDPDADTIFFLSDGNPSVGRITDPDLILNEVREWNRLRRVRIHGVALMQGEAPAAFRSLEDPERSEAFMRELTSANDGRFKLVK